MILVRVGDLLDAMRIPASVISGRSTLPALDHLLIEDRAGRAIVMGSNMEMQASMELTVTSITEGASFTVPKKVVAILGTLDENDTIELMPVDTANAGTWAMVRMKCGPVKYELLSYQGAKFPRMAEGGENASSFRVSAEAFRDCLKQVAPFTAPNFAGPASALSGVFLKLEENQLTATASDGHRLSRAKLSGGSFDRMEGENKVAIVSREVSEAIIRSLKKPKERNASVSIGGGVFELRAGDLSIRSRILDLKFPDVDRVIKRETKGCKNEITVSLKDMAATLRRCLALSKKAVNVRLECDGEGGVSVSFSDKGEDTSGVDVIPHTSTPGFQSVLLNGALLEEMLQVITDDEVTLRWGDPNTSAVSIRHFGQESTMLLMPVR